MRRVQEGGIKAREWKQRQAILEWHVEALEREARQGMATQGKVEWEELLGGEG